MSEEKAVQINCVRYSRYCSHNKHRPLSDVTYDDAQTLTYTEIFKHTDESSAHHLTLVCKVAHAFNCSHGLSQKVDEEKPFSSV